ncbi:uncharacterized protein LOC119311502 isoform X1 [Triticum dicoccoides]|uniref:uncharacterized protein LOC119311502 isoform X1 n=1 Tax=Triticum dicoccoides TaxID=85692 RepID=UPI001891A630|nr:uncharacterized protein LOC119311502 isoform X1 [Triticum dicoccoides]
MAARRPDLLQAMPRLQAETATEHREGASPTGRYGQEDAGEEGSPRPAAVPGEDGHGWRHRIPDRAVGALLLPPHERKRARPAVARDEEGPRMLTVELGAQFTAMDRGGRSAGGGGSRGGGGGTGWPGSNRIQRLTTTKEPGREIRRTKLGPWSWGVRI